ncbi:MAG: sigma-70 family RNA polymerase sigma factor [Dehalococcoidales bacterium]|nr:sigma-70 family RNA polymerase sigma factor [Dehalococcoidales bacterium]
MPDIVGIALPPVDAEDRRDAGSDVELITGLKRHDENAVLEAYRRYSDAIYRYVYYQVGDVHLAEDIVSEVFLRMIEKIGSYSYQGVPFSAWLYRIAHNLIADHYRGLNKHNGILMNMKINATMPDPAHIAESRLTIEQLQEAMRCLTEEQRRVVLLKFVEDMDNRQVAEVLGKSEGAIKSLQHRALEALRRLLSRGEGQ